MIDSPPSPDFPVLVIGAAGQDLVGQSRLELQPGTSNPGKIRRSFGGVGRNVAENLARLGHPVRLLTVVGADSPGDQLIHQLEEAGVDASQIIRLDDKPTSTYLAIVDPRGRMQLAVDDMRILSALTPDGLENRFSLFQEASLVFVDLNLTKESLRKVFTLAKRARIPVCADTTSFLLADRLKPYLPRLKLITPNLSEAEILCGFKIDPADRNEALDAAKCLISSGVEIAVITMAESGVCYATSETTGQVPALRTTIADPTGAGDALTSAVLFALLNDIPLDDAIRLGVSASSITLQYPGSVVPDLSLQKLYDRLII